MRQRLASPLQDCKGCRTLQEYIDDAKLAAQEAGRVCGEPLDEFIRRLAKERDDWYDAWQRVTGDLE
jgi:DNA-binding ferritin-like protein (Dps family)